MCRKLFLSFVVIALASCSDTFQDDLTIKMAETKKMPTTDTHFVSYSDVAALTKAESTSTRASSNATAEIKCITGNKTNDVVERVGRIGQFDILCFVAVAACYHSKCGEKNNT